MKTASLLLSFLLSFIPYHASLQQQDKRIALIIGNANYEDEDQSLNNPINDANAMKEVLSNLGFEVMECIDCNKRRMEEKIDRFSQSVIKEGFKVALFYYAGHGIQVEGRNYLVPTDASLLTEAAVQYDCVRADRVLAGLEKNTGTNIMILDACRNNPKTRSWNRGGAEEGLASMKAPAGTLIAYATQSGNVAKDGSGSNGLYTSKLIEYIKTPNLKLEEVFKRTRNAVMDASGNKQIPEEYSSIRGDFYFKRGDDDPDGDGIPNAYDACPNQAGLKRYGGCPEPANPTSSTNTPSPSESKFDFPVPSMVYVEGGSFDMGCNSSANPSCEGDESPVHQVTLDGFHIGKYEVTLAEFAAFVEDTKGQYTTGAELNGGSYLWGIGPDGFLYKEGIDWRHDVQGNLRPKSEYNHPVVHINWNDALAYCDWLSNKTGESYRLPTEAEWEFAARGGSKSYGNEYAGIGAPLNLAWFGTNSGGKTHAVGQKKANELGIYDLSGNVSEWCWDWYGELYYGDSKATNPKGPQTGEKRVHRGGNWYSSYQGEIRVANRDRNYPDTGILSNVGFRVAKSAN